MSKVKNTIFDEYHVSSLDEIEQIERDYLEDIYSSTVAFINKINKVTGNEISFKTVRIEYEYDEDEVND